MPVLGFLTFTVTFFMGLFPGSQLGAECASIFAIFTSQAWNMAFSFYQSLKTVPRDLDEASRSFGLSAWQRFWRLEAPFAAPGLIWNTMMSMSGGWFFVVASEAITVGDTTVQLPGIGSYLALAIEQKDFAAVGWAVLAMAIVIVLYDQLLFRPVVAWADKFRFEQTAGQQKPRSWVYGLIRRTRLVKRLSAPFGWAWQRLLLVRLGARQPQFARREAVAQRDSSIISGSRWCSPWRPGVPGRCRLRASDPLVERRAGGARRRPGHAAARRRSSSPWRA